MPTSQGRRFPRMPEGSGPRAAIWWFPHRGGVVIVMDVLWRQLHRYLRNWWLYGSLVTHN
jgi:hypothetical protein